MNTSCLPVHDLTKFDENKMFRYAAQSYAIFGIRCKNDKLLGEVSPTVEKNKEEMRRARQTFTVKPWLHVKIKLFLKNFSVLF